MVRYNYAENGAKVAITRSIFIYNAANGSFYNLEQTAAGGALYATKYCSILVSDSYFDHNQVYFSGYGLGGMIALYQGSIHVVNSTFSVGRAERGAVAYLSESQGVFSLSKVSSNRATYHGGVLYLVNSSLRLDQSLLDNNGANQGGVIFTTKSTIDVQNCIFVSNHAFGSNGNGGVMYAEMESVWSAKSCQFRNNSAELVPLHTLMIQFWKCE